MNFNKTDRIKMSRTRFDLSHIKRFTADPFVLYPTLVMDCIPGDKIKIGNEIVARMNPVATPVMHDMYIYTHYVFISYRTIDKDFTKIITGGKDGKYTDSLKTFSLDSNVGNIIQDDNYGMSSVGGLMDYLYNYVRRPSLPSRVPFSVYPIWAYYKAWFDLYRDENQIQFDGEDAETLGFSYSTYQGTFQQLLGEVHNRDSSYSKYFSIEYKNTGLLKRAWQKDYFTISLPWQQKGIPPALPISGILNLDFGLTVDNGISSTPYGVGVTGNDSLIGGTFQTTTAPGASAQVNNLMNQNLLNALNKGRVNLGEGLTFNVSDLRLVFQTQRWMERNARGGSRYVEFLKSQFDVFVRDDRLQRAEYIGGTKSPIIISEVLQTSETTGVNNNLGEMAGHGITADRTYAGSYFVREHGILLGLTSFMVKPAYTTGVKRNWLYQSRYDTFFQQFQHLSEQAVYQSEIFPYKAQQNPVPSLGDDPIWGYIGRYDEYRTMESTVHGLFRTDFIDWHLARTFSTAPVLNPAFLYPTDDEIDNVLKRCMAVPTEPMFLVTIGNKIIASRPIPYMSVPGLVDH